MKNPLVSVVVPVFNVEHYLRECLDSIVTQTYTNIEVILVDDGSTDSSGHICDEYAQRDCRITVIHKENGGLSDARNTGIDACSGQFIGFVDSDDYVDPRFIELMLTPLLSGESDISVCQFHQVYVHGQTCQRVEEEGKVSVEYISNMEALKLLIQRRWDAVPVSACSKVYDVKLWKEIRFPKGHLYEDEYVAHLLLHKAKRVALVHERLYYYYKRIDSITVSNYTLRHLDDVRAQEACLQYLQNNSLIELAEMAKALLYRTRKEHYVKLYSCQDPNGKIFAKEMRSRILESFAGILVNRHTTLTEKMSGLFFILAPNVYRHRYMKKEQKRLEAIKIERGHEENGHELVD